MKDEPLRQAARVQRAAARRGFDWPRGDPRVWAKLVEEIRELRRARGASRRADELGDLLFMIVNLSRHLDVDAARALRGATAKFARRYAYVQRHARRLPRAQQRDLARLDALWNEAKRRERKAGRVARTR
jgi:ATP diphosphatase